MISSNWIDVINERFLAYGMSLSSDESILNSKKIAFNQVLRDLKQKYPHKKLFHLILAMRDHYEIEFLKDLLDDENRLDIRSEVAQDNGLILAKKRKRH
jgi:hypothetical protein